MRRQSRSMAKVTLFHPSVTVDSSEMCMSDDPSVKITKCDISCCNGDLCNGGKVPVVSAIVLLACALVAALR